MTVARLTLRDFRSYRAAEVELGHGVTLVQGRNGAVALRHPPQLDDRGYGNLGEKAQFTFLPSPRSRSPDTSPAAGSIARS